MAGKEESIKAIIYNADAFAALLENTSALETVISNDAGRTAIIKAMEYYANASNVIQAVKDDLGSIKKNIHLIGNESSVEKTDKCMDAINSTVQALDKVVSNADVVIDNLNIMMDSPTVMDTLLSNQSAVNSIFDNPKSRAAIAGKMQSGGKALIASLYNSSLVISYMQTHASAIYSDASTTSSTRSATIQGTAYITDYTGSFVNTVYYESKNWYEPDGAYKTETNYNKKINVFGYNFIAKAQCPSGGADYCKGFYVYGFKF